MSSRKATAKRPAAKGRGRNTGGKAGRKNWKGRSRRPQWILPTVVALLVAALIGGIVFLAQQDISGINEPSSATGPDGSQLIGDPDAPVLVEEYADFQCPACADFERRTAPVIKELVDEGKIRFAFHPIAILDRPGTSGSRDSAAAATCAAEAGAFQEYKPLLFQSQGAENDGGFEQDNLVELGRQAGLAGDDFGAFEDCVRDGTYEGWITDRTGRASEEGVRGTPTVLINDQVLNLQAVTVEQPLPDLLRAAVEEEIKKAENGDEGSGGAENADEGADGGEG